MSNGTAKAGQNRVHVTDERCKGCRFCIEFCPQHIIYESAETNSRGYSIVRMEDGGHCIGCEMCTMVCPEFAIHVVGQEDGA